MGRPVSSSLGKIVAELSAYDMVVVMVKSNQEPLPKSATESLFFQNREEIEAAMIAAGAICVQGIIAKRNAPIEVETVEVEPTPEAMEYATKIAAGHQVRTKKALSA